MANHRNHKTNAGLARDLRAVPGSTQHVAAEPARGLHARPARTPRRRGDRRGARRAGQHRIHPGAQQDAQRDGSARVEQGPAILRQPGSRAMTAIEKEPAGPAETQQPEDLQQANSDTFPPLHRNRDFILLWTGAGVSILGSRISAIAYSLVVLWSTNSPTLTSYVAFA